LFFRAESFACHREQLHCLKRELQELLLRHPMFKSSPLGFKHHGKKESDIACQDFGVSGKAGSIPISCSAV
jgi:hypothetical protein